VHPLAQPGQTRQLIGALALSVVQLVERPQVVLGEGIEVLACVAQRGEDLRG
jgi:hypothetical protein